LWLWPDGFSSGIYCNETDLGFSFIAFISRRTIDFFFGFPTFDVKPKKLISALDLAVKYFLHQAMSKVYDLMNLRSKGLQLIENMETFVPIQHQNKSF